MSDFAPYQPAPDDRSRLSKAKLKAPASPPKPSLKYQPIPTQSSSLTHSASALEAGIGSSSSAPTGGGEQVQGQIRVNKYETSLPVRVDVEAALTYALGAVTGVFFLIVEQKNDYVRFHAWQSSLLFLTLMLVHFIIMFISSLLSWLLFFANIALVAWLGYRAYMDGASLERYEVPFFGALASQWVDSE